MDFQQTVGGGWIRHNNYDFPAVLTIRGDVEVGQYQNGETSYAIGFEETPMRLGLNAGNRVRLIELFGRETRNYQGNRVELYVEPTQFQGQATFGVRVRAPQGGSIPQGGQAFNNAPAPGNNFQSPQGGHSGQNDGLPF
jgi:hypothetical protein